MSDTETTFPRCKAASRKRKPPSPLAGLRLIGSEPFRIFFPLGLLISLCGVGLWPVFYAGWIDFHPGIAHARLMTLGFLGAFVMGFVGTAMPRMLSAPKLTLTEMAVFLAALGSLAFSFCTGRVLAGDIAFLVMTGAFLLSMTSRWIFMRKEHPPVEFIFSFLGIVCAFVGAIILVRAAFVFPGMETYRLAQLLCYEGFLFFPVLGVGAFLAPRLLFENPQDGRRPSQPWIYPIAAVALLASLVLESKGYIRTGFGIRLATVAVFLLTTTAIFRRTRTPGSLSFALRVALFSILAGLLCGALWPHLKIGMEHIAFISGFGLLALTIATRVTLGHAGEGALFFKKHRCLKWIVILVLIAMSTRVVAEAIPKIMVSHHVYAALLWIVAGIIWFVWLLPRFKQRDPDDN